MVHEVRIFEVTLTSPITPDTRKRSRILKRRRITVSASEAKRAKSFSGALSLKIKKFKGKTKGTIFITKLGSFRLK